MVDPKQALAEAFERHSDELFRHAAIRLPSRERALELTQESFMKAWEYVRKGGEVRQYRSFLYRVLNNLIIDEYRRAKTHSLDAMLEGEEGREGAEGQLLRDETDELESAMVRYDAARAMAVLRELPEPYREAIVLRYIDGWNVIEIAEHLNESQNAVSVRLHRALRKLRELLEIHESI